MTGSSQLNAPTVIVLIVGAIILIPLLMGGGMMGGAGMVGGVMFLWPLLLIGLILVLVSNLGDSDETEESDRAMAILREGYARGELSEEQFEKRRRRLRSRE